MPALTAWVISVGLFACAPTAPPSPAKETTPALVTRKNSLNMELLPVPGTNIHMSIWETRVQDFAVFVDETDYDATENFYYYEGRSWRRDTRYWRDPGHPQTDQHPVVGISWRDAVHFCQWLTERERRLGVINNQQVYRLPTDAEWSLAAGPGEEVFAYNAFANYHPNLELDSHAATSPVGFFPANAHGFYDLAGNAWEYCLDKRPYSDDFRVIRGGSWQNWHPQFVGVQARGYCGLDVRITLYGFRIVLADEDARYHEMISDAHIPSDEMENPE